MPSERALFTQRRKEAYEALHPETKNGTNQHSSLRQVGEPSARFTADTAARTGQSEHFSEWVRLTGERAAGASCATSLPDGRKAGPQHQQRGINAATRELHIDRTEAQRAVKIDSLSDAALSLVRRTAERCIRYPRSSF